MIILKMVSSMSLKAISRGANIAIANINRVIKESHANLILLLTGRINLG